MIKTYVTFGQDHTHRINGVTYDADCVAVITGSSSAHNRQRAFDLFDKRFCFEYPETSFDPEIMKYFPRGLIPVGDD